jgi:uncharacterized protein (TIGR02145 family)
MSSNTYALARIPIVERPRGYYLRWYYNGWHYWQFFAGQLGVNSDGEKYRTYGTRTLAINSGQLTEGQVSGLRTILNSKETYILTTYGWMALRIDAGTAKVYDNQFGGYEMQLTATIGSRLPSTVTGLSPVVPPVIVPPAALCETVIGTQVWLCKNWDGAYPASKVYDNDEANRAKYGGLYTYDQVNSAGFVPEGWEFPTIEQWRTLIAFVGGATIAGGKLKQAGTTNWESPNAGADNAFGFDGLAAGYFGIVINEDWTYRADFANLQRFGYFWAKSPEGLHMCFLLSFDTGEVIELPYVPAPDPAFQPYHSVRFIKSTPPTIYNGWGALYNYPAMINAHGFAPAGWHLPSDTELIELYTAVGGDSVAGGKLKEAGTAHWDINNLSTNDYGFKMWGTGYRDCDGNFVPRLLIGYLGSITTGPSESIYFMLFYSNTLGVSIGWYGLGKAYGWPLRFVKDDSTDPSLVSIDGKVYETVKIGSKVWTKNCIAITHYADGTPIPVKTDNTDWNHDTDGAMCWHNNIPE